MSTVNKPNRPPTIGVVPIETRSRTKMFRVDYNGCPIGLVEKMPDDRCTRNPWKSTLGIGFNTTFLGVIYAARPGAGFQALAKQIAVDAVIAAHEGIDVSGDAFEKAYGADAVIPAWRKSLPAPAAALGSSPGERDWESKIYGAVFNIRKN